MKPSNPFLISGYCGPEYFCDRERETGTILDALLNGRNITLIAPRRMGKTGLIQQSFYRAREAHSDVSCFYMDIYSTQSLGDFVRLFADTVLGRLDSTPQKVIARIGKILRSCRPSITFDQLTGTPKISIDITPGREEATLREIFDYLATSDRRIYIAIDEFQQIAEYPEKGVEALLRSYIQFAPNIGFIFAGSKQHVMHRMFATSRRPFYQSTQILTIGCIDREQYERFAGEKFAAAALNLPSEVFRTIYDRLDGHTWYVQAILNRLYGYGHTPDTVLIDRAVDQIVAEMDYTYSDLLKTLPAGSARLLKAVAQDGRVAEITSGDFIARHGLRAASSVSSALKRLVDNEIIYPSDTGYMVYDRFLSEWLRRRSF